MSRRCRLVASENLWPTGAAYKKIIFPLLSSPSWSVPSWKLVRLAGGGALRSGGLPYGLTASAMIGPRSAATCGTGPNAVSQPDADLRSIACRPGDGRPVPGGGCLTASMGQRRWSTVDRSVGPAGELVVKLPVCQVLLGLLLVGDAVNLEVALPPG